MTSLRRAALLATAAGMAAVLLAAGVAVYAVLRAGLMRQLDASLLRESGVLQAAVEQEGDALEAEFDDLATGDFRAGGGGYLQLCRTGGACLYRSPSLGGADLPRGEPAPGPTYAWTRRDGRRVRVVQAPFRPRVEGRRTEPMPLTLLLGRDASATLATLALARATLLAVGAAALAVTLAVLWLAVRRSLRSVDALAGRIGAIAPDALSARLGADGAPRELLPVVTTLDGLLARLEAAMRRERAFSADVAHELRTPLAALRSAVEVALSRPRAGEDYRETLEDCRTPLLRMQAIVESLLALARLEAGLTPVRPEPVDVDRLVRTLWEPLDRQAAARRLDVRWSLAAPGPVATDPSLLVVALQNVLGNAVAHADAGGQVVIETAAGEQPGEVRVRVANTGSRLGPEDAPRVFDRFWRGDAARSEADGHCGLGLAVVRRAVEALGGRVRADAGRDGWFELSLHVGGA